MKKHNGDLGDNVSCLFAEMALPKMQVVTSIDEDECEEFF
jgi:hypothetical protein